MVDDQAELDRVSAEVVDLVRRMLAEGKRGMILVNVHPDGRRRIGKPIPWELGKDDTASQEAA